MLCIGEVENRGQLQLHTCVPESFKKNAGTWRRNQPLRHVRNSTSWLQHDQARTYPTRWAIGISCEVFAFRLGNNSLWITLLSGITKAEILRVITTTIVVLMVFFALSYPRFVIPHTPKLTSPSRIMSRKSRFLTEHLRICKVSFSGLQRWTVDQTGGSAYSQPRSRSLSNRGRWETIR